MRIIYFLRNGLTNNWVMQRIRYQKAVFTKPKRGSLLEKQGNVAKLKNQKIRETVAKAQKNVATNTPRIIGGFLILFSIPQFKLIYDLFYLEYNDRRFYERIKQSLEWYNVKSAFLIGGIFGLEAIKFIDKKAKYTIGQSKYRFLFLLVPFTFNLLSISYFNIVDKKIIFGNVGGNVASFLIEAKMTTEGTIPYWLYNIKYHMILFDLITLAILYGALKKLKNEMVQKPHTFVELETIQ